MYMIADTRIAPCYVYVHEEMHSLARALELGEFTWFSPYRALIEQLASSRGRLDSDYSPSKPTSKIARFATVAASWFAQSPGEYSHGMFKGWEAPTSCGIELD